MEAIILFITENVNLAHYMIFFLLLLAGLNIPLSEDLLVLAGGYLAGRYAPESALLWYGFIFAGCWISAWECYWLGRLLGPKLYEIRWFKRWLTPALIERIHVTYEKYGIFTFIIGRFIPGGVRNALFLSSGLGKMPFGTFALRDGAGCLLSSGSLYLLGFSFAENSDFLFHFSETYRIITVGFFILLALGILYSYLYLRKKASQ